MSSRRTALLDEFGNRYYEQLFEQPIRQLSMGGRERGGQCLFRDWIGGST
jgi:hypothetical protein